MRNFIRSITLMSILGLSILSAFSARAAAVTYSNFGSQNSDSYSFTATSTGQINAYFHGATAAYANTLTMLVNGVATPETSEGVFHNHSSQVGDFLNLGFVNQGDVITFQLNVLTTGRTWSSDHSLNSDQVNHVFSTSFGGDVENNIPAGTYVGFEDLIRGGDFDYDDEAFVFTNISAVPEPETYAMLLAGLLMISYQLRRTKMVKFSV
ncbi:PEP-CTERM sorting domain-containing protein [Nitrosomonas sp. JL21]|nr:DUF4114 domain-containing protein [Nitrosomonas sp.]MCC7091135.1 DUF4114 domain-containing protein [Nitrosomonas sp.]MXS77431.1 PEP-CTERM sorting domain-containing protein [Nitrosomonas sp. JL21]